MNQDSNQPHSFFDAEPKDIGLATRVDGQNPIYKSSYQENWCCAWAPDCSYVAWSQGGGIVYLLPWDRNIGRLLKRPASQRGNDSSSTDLDSSVSVFLHNLPRLSRNADGSDDAVLSNNPSWLDTEEMERRSYRIDCTDMVWSLAFGSGFSENSINLWRRFVFNHDLILATGLQGGKIKLWNVYKGHLLMELIDHRSLVRGLSFTSDGSLQLISCSNDCTIKFWDLNRDGNMYKTVRFDNAAMVFQCKWSPSCKQVAAVGTNKCAYVWNTSDLRTPRKLVGHLHTVSSCEFSPDGALLATASYDTRVIVWDPFTGDMIRTLGHLFPTPRPIYAGGANDHYVRDLSFSKDGVRLSTVADDGFVRVWNLEDDKLNPKYIAESHGVISCSYSPNGHCISTGSRDGRIEFWSPDGQVPSLQHKCRSVVRQQVSTQRVDHLPLPIRLKEFLKYHLY